MRHGTHPTETPASTEPETEPVVADTPAETAPTVAETPEAKVEELKTELAEAETAEAAANSTETIRVVAPWWVQGFNTVGADGSKISVDRKGTTVDASAVDAILNAAEKSGITLKVGK